jgi:hypothetical protein
MVNSTISNIHMKKILLAVSAFIFFGCSSSKVSSDAASNIQVNRIWAEAPHSAFTGLIRFKDKFYCTFRESSAHVRGSDGKIRVLRSGDGKNWQSIALLAKPAIDLRDPMLSVTPDDKIMLSIGGSVYDPQERAKLLAQHPMVSYSDAAGDRFSEPENVTVEPRGEKDWIWRITWNKGVGYGIDYADKKVTLVKTTDGKTYQKLMQLAIDGMPNESTIRFDKNDKIYVLVRREEADQMGVLAKSEPPYTEWTYQKLGMRLGGPNFIFSENGKQLIIGSRLYEPTGAETGIVITDLNGKILKKIKLPSKGDTSYTGLVLYDGKLWVSYYSSHEEKTAIYLATIPEKQLKS